MCRIINVLNDLFPEEKEQDGVRLGNHVTSRRAFKTRNVTLKNINLKDFGSGPYMCKDTRKIKPIQCNFGSQKKDLRKQEVAHFSSTPSL